MKLSLCKKLSGGYNYPDFKDLEESDLDIISYYTEKYNKYSCEFSCLNLYLWNEIYHYQWSFYNEWLVVIDTQSDTALMPLGENVTIEGLVSLSCALVECGFSGDIANVSLDHRRSVFIGGVPRPLRAGWCLRFLKTPAARQVIF